MQTAYNLLNLPSQVKQNNAVKANYTYLANGAKLATTNAGGIGYNYFGSFVYKKNNDNLELESVSFGGGRIINSTSAQEINYFITDHLGSTRAIVNQNGQIQEQKDYYPFGLEHDNTNLAANAGNRYRFSGKELQTK